MLDKSHIDGNGNIVIQNADKSTITINLFDTEALRQFIIEFQNKLSEFPKEIITEIQKHNKLEYQVKAGANIYLSVVGEFTRNSTNKVYWNITIINLTKEHRYFYQPYFKTSNKLKMSENSEHDTFILLLKNSIDFPTRLEYGQVLNLQYEVNKNLFSLFKAYEDNSINAYCQTTVGELYDSNVYKFERFLKEYEQIINTTLA